MQGPKGRDGQMKFCAKRGQCLLPMNSSEFSSNLSNDIGQGTAISLRHWEHEVDLF